MEFGSLIAPVGKQLLQERIHPEQSGKKQDTAVTILDIGGVNDGVEQQTQRIYKKVALLAFDPLARIIAMRIDTGPPLNLNRKALAFLRLASIRLMLRKLCNPA